MNYATCTQVKGLIYEEDLQQKFYHIVAEEITSIEMDYRLDDGTILYSDSWNGECYYENGHNYYPVTQYNEESEDYTIIAFYKL